MVRKLSKLLLAAVPAALLMVIGSSATAAPVTGAIYTTDSTCSGVNLNIFASKGDVYLDGGPLNPNGPGLSDGAYYVKVTEPDGTLLGSSLTAVAVVSGGEFTQCYRLADILVKASDASPGYDDSSNPGGEYKVWASQDPSFAESASRTDNFRVKPDVTAPSKLKIRKFYDANANGVFDTGDTEITGWKMRIQDGVDYVRYTPVDITVAPDVYTITEAMPIQTNWATTTINPQVVTLDAGQEVTVDFGNLCLGAGGGLTLGFWSNKNGQALVGSDDLACLTALNLVKADGSAFDPGIYSALRTWLLNGTATNMSYMLSVQLAAMKLNVHNGFVSGSALVYAPGATSANTLGYATISALMTEANTALGANGNTTAAGPDRTYQEALKNALDKANNNLNFVQAAPCAFTFAD
jgi:hypothetical protein